jgi:hypothetical protein
MGEITIFLAGLFIGTGLTGVTLITHYTAKVEYFKHLSEKWREVAWKAADSILR